VELRASELAIIRYGIDVTKLKLVLHYEHRTGAEQDSKEGCAV
jgi:hypothetical protein